MIFASSIKTLGNQIIYKGRVYTVLIG